jgi:hypothetical protein
MTRFHALLCGAVLAAAFCYAGTPQPADSGPVVSFTAKTANVSGAPDAIRIEILRWSTDAERDKLMDAWEMKTPTTGQGAGGRGADGRGGRGGAARGGAAPAGVGRGGAGQAAAGRGGRGAAESSPEKPTPEGMFATALNASTTVGYLWSSEVAGYAIRYAGKTMNPDGSERIVLITNRRLGAVNGSWKPAGTEPPAYDFSVIELHVKANGEGEGKASINGRVGPDSLLKIVALENYDALPVVLSNVHRSSAGK